MVFFKRSSKNYLFPLSQLFSLISCVRSLQQSRHCHSDVSLCSAFDVYYIKVSKKKGSEKREKVKERKKEGESVGERGRG